MTTFNAREFVSDSLFSDMHKDAFGSRPGQGSYARWYAMSEAELIAERDYLAEAIEREMDRELAAKKRAAERFEAEIAATIAHGAADRATAIRWLMDAEGISDDVEHFEWAMGIDFGYIAGAPRPIWTKDAHA